MLLASQEVAIRPNVGLRANASRYIIALIDGINKLPFMIQAKGTNKSWSSTVGGVMHKIENFQESAEHCFELASSQNLLEEDVALEAFELLTANQYDYVLAHGLGVSL
ncbi:MAG: hypothetical protein WAM71_07250 [Candidatus Korobacteraceae bacterium]